MKVKVSEYIADFMVENGVEHVFTVVGGGAMHLNDSFGHHPKLTCIYNHHEQASAIAAEAYQRIHNKMAAVCVTSGPGAINALNGVVGAYMDSIPMIVISGQTKSTMTVRNSGLRLRTLGNQEFDIVSALDNVAKYSEMIVDKNRIKYCLQKAFSIARHGRPGPCWLDIPLDIQGSFVETTELISYDASTEENVCDSREDLEVKVREIVTRLKSAKRPVIYAGNGIRISGSVKLFHELIDKIGVPVVTCWDSIDLMETDDKCYAGRGGTMGDRCGNFAVQNSDLLITIGSRLNVYQVGYNKDTWARGAFVVVNDIDAEELKKPTIHVDMPICCDAALLIQLLYEHANELSADLFNAWREQCYIWKTKYPVVQSKHYEDQAPVNVYAFIDSLSKTLPADAVTVVANGSASVVGSQAYYIGKNQRFIMNCGLSSMGYDLPAAIGACIGNDRQEIVCIAGDGSVQMNLQELQTIVTNRLPIKIFIINNDGYHQIRLTQNNLFQGKLVGVGPESGDLGFPNFERLAYAYEIPYYQIVEVDEMQEIIEKVLQKDIYCICEVFCTTNQVFEPKSATKRAENGTLISPPLEDLAPFLSREELAGNMYIDLL